MASFTVSRCWQLQRVDWPLVYTSPPSVVGYRHYLAHGVGVQNVYTIVQCRRYLITGCWLVCLSSLSLDEGICVHIHCFVIAYTEFDQGTTPAPCMQAGNDVGTYYLYWENIASPQTDTLIQSTPAFQYVFTPVSLYLLDLPHDLFFYIQQCMLCTYIRSPKNVIMVM